MDTDTAPRIPGYRIVRPLGQGAMASVYLAMQESLDREVALKVMAPSLVADASFCRRFLQEGRIVAQLSHPNIPTIYDIGSQGAWYYMAVEFLPGGDLSDRIHAGMTVTQARAVLTQIARALGYAHQRGFVHRDVKPANILFRADGTALLSDFGIAKAARPEDTQITQAGFSIGTPNYMSPEQAMGEELDGRSDLYSLGVVLFEMLTGRKPFQAGDAVATAMAHLNQPIPRLPAAVARFQALLDGLLAKERDARYADADAVLADLTGVPEAADDATCVIAPAADATVAIGSSPSHAARPRQAPRPESSPAPARVPARGRSWAVWSGVAAAVLASVAGGGYVLSRPGTQASADAATPAGETGYVFCPPAPRVALSAEAQARVTRLLEAAEVHVMVGNLVVPPGSSALFAYQEVLDQDPGNATACKGLADITSALLEQARAAQAAGDAAQARATLRQAWQVAPEHPALRRLRADLESQLGPIDLGTDSPQT